MPYIKQDKRNELDVYNLKRLPEVPGELNYMISKLCHHYISSKGLSYTIINEVVGALECAKLELYRTLAADLEDKKRVENGPVSVLDSPVGPPT